MTTDPEFAISGYVVNGLATVYCRWVNKGQFQKEAWDGVPLASMDVRAVMEGFGVFVDSQQGSQMQNRLLYVVGSSVYFRPAYDGDHSRKHMACRQRIVSRRDGLGNDIGHRRGKKAAVLATTVRR